MDKRQWISAISLSAAIFALWMGFNLWYQKHYPPQEPSAAPVVAQSTIAPVAATPTTGASTTEPTTNAVAAPAMSAGIHAVAATQPSDLPVVLGSDDKGNPTYAAQLSLTADGAAVSDVTLNRFFAPDDGTHRNKPKPVYNFETPLPDHPDTRVLGTRTLVIDGKSIDLWNVPWTLVSSDSSSAIFSVVIDDGAGNHLAEVSKTYALGTIGAADGNKGYEVTVTQSIRNLRGDKPITVHTLINGPTSPPSESEQGNDRSVIVGYRKGDASISTEAHLDTEFKPDSPEKDLTADGAKHFVWAGQSSSYFGAIVLPTDKPGSADLTVRALALNPSAVQDKSRDVAMTFQTPDITLAPGAETAVPLSVFFGPKWRTVFGDPHYSMWPRIYSNLLDVRSGWCGICAWGWLISALVWILGAFHIVVRDWGLSIICLVVCVRFLLHPITKRSQVQMMKMGKMAPEVEKLKKKYADQPDQLNKEMMKLYKEQSGAILGCLPMFLQTPIWIALWTALQGTFELRQAPFLMVFGHHLTWIHDLANPDMLIPFSQPIVLPFVGWHVRGINILPLLMAVVTYINQRYFMPVPLATTPEQEQQQKMQRGMSLIFPLMFYSLPSGLNLYYLTSTSLGILESKIIRDHIKEQEELAKAMGPELVATKATRGSRKGGKVEAEESKPGLLGRLLAPVWEAMQKASERAEEIRKESNKGGKKK